MKRATLHLISGPMFAGKTDQLIRKHQNLLDINIDKETIKVFKPSKDTRDINIKSRVGLELTCQPIENSRQILDLIENNTKYVFIDEFQFLDEELRIVVEELLAKEINVIVAGLDKLFNRKEFERYSELKEISNFKTFATAVCHGCGKTAFYSKRESNSESEIVIEGEATYTAACLDCHKE